MRVHFAGRRPGIRCAPTLCVLIFSSLMGLPSLALADVLVAPGQIALLTVSINVEGKMQASQGTRDEGVRWSTQRSFEATVRMEAEKPEQLSYSAMTGNDEDAMPQVYSDMAKQVEACGTDQACVMRLAMQMAGSQELKEATESPPRYQQWKAAGDNAMVTAKASYEDVWHTVFYTGAKEITDCTLTAPMVSPAITSADPSAQATWDKINRETLQASAQGFVIETDAETGTSQLFAQVVAAGSGDEKCTLDIGGTAETQHQTANGILLPVGEMKAPVILDGSAPGTAVIASGSELIETRMPLTNLGAGFSTDLAVPLKVKVVWELKAQ
jgi:hypothetical protein